MACLGDIKVFQYGRDIDVCEYVHMYMYMHIRMCVDSCACMFRRGGVCMT